MNRLNQLTHQHDDIKNIIKVSKELLNTLETAESQKLMAKNISQLAGILKIHLGNEDKFLYPKFIESDDALLKRKAESYKNEMGDLSSVFTAFKDKYNTPSKLQNNLASAKTEISNVFKAIEERIKKEDHDLYKLASKLM